MVSGFHSGFSETRQAEQSLPTWEWPLGFPAGLQRCHGTSAEQRGFRFAQLVAEATFIFVLGGVFVSFLEGVASNNKPSFIS